MRARHVALHAVAPPARHHVRHLRPGAHRLPGGAGGTGLGMNVLAWGQASRPEKARPPGMIRAQQGRAVRALGCAFAHVRLRPDTSGIVGAEDLARMKPTALFVNIARAELVQPGALLEALQEGPARLRGG